MPPTVQQIIKAAADISGRTTYDLAVVAGVRTSRVKRILSGRTLPRDHEVTSLLSAAGVDLEALTAQTAQPGIREAIRELAGYDLAKMLMVLLASLRTSPIQQAVDHSDLIIDRLSVTFSVRSEARFIREIHRLFPANTRVRVRRRSLYQSGSWSNDVFIEHSPVEDHLRFARIDFNPSSPMVSWGLIRAIWSMAVASESHVTRVDPAIDYRIRFGEVDVISTRARKLKTVVSDAGVETMYLGSEKAKQVRIYDKARELRQKTQSQVVGPLTRFEGQHRNTGLSLLQLPLLPNLFRDLVVLPLVPLNLPLPQRLLVRHAQFFGLLPLKAELSEGEFDELTKTLERATNAPVLPHPSDIFAAQWPAACADLLKRIGVTGAEAITGQRGVACVS